MANHFILNRLREIYTALYLLAYPDSSHTARHTFATTITLNNGVPLETVSKMLGHTNIRTTQIYARLLPGRISDDMNTLAQKLGATPKNAMGI